MSSSCFMTESQWAQCCTGLLQIITGAQGYKSHHPFQVRGRCSCSMGHIIKFCNQDLPSYSKLVRGLSDIQSVRVFPQVWTCFDVNGHGMKGEGNASKIAQNTS